MHVVCVVCTADCVRVHHGCIQAPGRDVRRHGAGTDASEAQGQQSDPGRRPLVQQSDPGSHPLAQQSDPARQHQCSLTLLVSPSCSAASGNSCACAGSAPSRTLSCCARATRDLSRPRRSFHVAACLCLPSISH